MDGTLAGHPTDIQLCGMVSYMLGRYFTVTLVSKWGRGATYSFGLMFGWATDL